VKGKIWSQGPRPLQRLNRLPLRVTVAAAPSPERQRATPLPVLLPHELAEAKKLRKLGWSVNGLARRYGCKPGDIERDLGIQVGVLA
jgi:hypothetical protein